MEMFFLTPIKGWLRMFSANRDGGGSRPARRFVRPNRFFLAGRSERIMTTGKAPQFEIPTDMRKLTEQSMEHVKTAISAYLDFCKRSVPTDVLGGSALGNKIFGYAEGNLAKAFEFGERLAQVRDPQEFAKLQMDFIQGQMQSMTEQAKELGEAATKAMHDSAKPATKGGLSS
jgi:hypothetical protein